MHPINSIAMLQFRIKSAQLESEKSTNVFDDMLVSVANLPHFSGEARCRIGNAPDDAAERCGDDDPTA
jgi:hypothetical protein